MDILNYINQIKAEEKSLKYSIKTLEFKYFLLHKEQNYKSKVFINKYKNVEFVNNEGQLIKCLNSTKAGICDYTGEKCPHLFYNLFDVFDALPKCKVIKENKFTNKPFLIEVFNIKNFY